MSKLEKEIIRRINSLEYKIETLTNQIGSTQGETNEIIDVPEYEVKMEVLDDDLMRKSIGLLPGNELADEVELKFSNWIYKWNCNFLNVCYTTYSGSCFVVNKSNGQTLTWNLMESASRKDHNSTHWAVSPNYHHKKSGTTIGFGFGKHEHRSCHVSSNANFYGEWGKISFTWKATAC